MNEYFIMVFNYQIFFYKGLELFLDSMKFFGNF